MTLQSTESITRFPTTEDQRHDLLLARFIHVTGLVIYGPRGERRGVFGEGLQPYWLGRWSKTGGMLLLVTLGGEFWLGSGEIWPCRSAGNHSFFRGIIMPSLCPNGQGAFGNPLYGDGLTCVGGMLERMLDPGWEPRGR